MLLGWILKLLLLLVSLANPLWLVALMPLFLRWQGGASAMATSIGVLLVGLSLLSRLVGLVTGGASTTAVAMWIAGNGLFLWGYFKDRKSRLTARLLPWMIPMDAITAFVLFVL